MTTEPKNVRLARLRAALARAESNLRMATSRARWADAERHANEAADLDRQIHAVEAEPETIRVVGRPRVRG
jgi:hypothetical protein